MGKLSKNKVQPEKDFKVKKDNFFKKNKGTPNKWKDSFKKNKGNTPEKIEKPKVKPVKDDPFFVSSNSEKPKNDGSGQSFFTRKEGSKRKFSLDSRQKEEDKRDRVKIGEGKNTLSRSFTKLTLRKKRGSEDMLHSAEEGKKKFFTLKKDKTQFLTSPASSGKFLVKTQNITAPSTSSKDGPVEESLEAGESTKKPFDKKKWRMQKYSKRYKLDQWEEKRKKAILKDYYKDNKDTGKKFDVQKIYEQYQSDDENDENDVENENNLNSSINNGKNDSINNAVGLNKKSRKDESWKEEINLIEEEQQKERNQSPSPNNAKQKKAKSFKKAKDEYQRIKDEKKQRKEELARKRKERDEALKKYKEKKVEKFKKLNRRTKKGQPIMKDRIEMLLDQIQTNLGKK